MRSDTAQQGLTDASTVCLPLPDTPTPHASNITLPGSAFSSTLVRNLAQVLPSYNLLKRFDLLRTLVKNKRRVPSTKQQQLAKLSKRIKLELVQKYHELPKSGEGAQKVKTIKKSCSTSGSCTLTNLSLTSYLIYKLSLTCTTHKVDKIYCKLVILEEHTCELKEHKHVSMHTIH